MKLEEKYLRTSTFHQIFQDVAKQHSYLNCLYDKKYYSYEQISQKVNVVASYLKNNFAEGTKIGLYFVQSLDYVVSFLAVMQAGCTVVPVSALNSTPLERIKNYLNCDVKVVLTTRELQENISRLYLDILLIEEGEIVHKLIISSKQDDININYRYDPEDVLGILRAKVKTIGINNIYTPGLDWIIGNHDISLAEYLVHEKQLYLSSGKNLKNKTLNKTLLIPYRISSIHWVGILIDIINTNQDFIINKIIVVDSAKISFCHSIVTQAIRSCASIYSCLEKIVISQQEDRLIQHDFTSCGPLVIENLLLVAGIKVLSNDITGRYIDLVSLIRKEHINCYKQQINFSNKQSNAVNLSLDQLLIQAGKKLFTVEAKYSIIQVALFIQKNKRYHNELISMLKLMIAPDCFAEAKEWIEFVLYNQSLQQQEIDEKIYIKLFDLIRLFINKEKIRPSAYILNTSGSTGMPKKIAIQHDGLPFCMQASHDFLQITVKDRISAFADIAFDAHIFDIMMALGKGACLYIVPCNIRTDTIRLGQFYSSHKITITVLTPSMLQTLEPKNFPNLRVLLSTGEMLDSGIIKSWKKFNNNILFINGYGPSEVTIATTMGICEANQPPHIGRPILGLEIFILEKEPKDSKAPVRVLDGEEGELYITGYGVSKLGYIDNPELTNERFVEISHPDNSSKSIRCFRTRDLVKVDTTSGLIMIVGRIDRQCKINGKLCCPEEIESHIKSSAPDIIRVYVNINENEAVITAYIQLNYTAFSQDRHVMQRLVNILYEKLSKTLPNYMLPSRWMFTDNIKLNNSGKIDINDILLLEKNSTVYFPRNTTRMLPSNYLQKKISNIFRDILNLSPLTDIYVDDSFDKLGANSLQLEMLFIKIKQHCRIEMLPLQRQTILQEPTVLNIERQINISELNTNQNYPQDLSIITLLNPIDLQDLDRRPAIFLIHSVFGDAVQDYYKIIPYFHDFRLLGISYPKLYEDYFNISDIKSLANKYIHYIKAVQPEGPYFIIGWSLGGLIALNMVASLEDNGEIAHCVMLDSILFNITQSECEHAKILITLFNHVKKLLGLQNVSLTIEDVLANCTSKEEQIRMVAMRCSLIMFSTQCCSAISPQNIIAQLKIILSMRNLLLAIVNYDPDIRLINSNSIVVAEQSFNLYFNEESNILPRLHGRPLLVAGNHFEVLNNKSIYSYIKQQYSFMEQILKFSHNVINALPKYLNTFNIINNVYNICKIIFDHSWLNFIIKINTSYPDVCYKVFLKILDWLVMDLKQTSAIICYDINILRRFFSDDPLRYLRKYILDPKCDNIVLYLDNFLYDILNILCDNFKMYEFMEFVRDCKLDEDYDVMFKDVFIEENPCYLSMNNLKLFNGKDRLFNAWTSISSEGQSYGYEQSESVNSECDCVYSDVVFDCDFSDDSEGKEIINAFAMADYDCYYSSSDVECDLAHDSAVEEITNACAMLRIEQGKKQKSCICGTRFKKYFYQ